MYEVELKVRADHDAVRDRLAALGATSRGRVTQVDTYYDAPHRAFGETDEALRLRRIEDSDASPRLTYKGPRIDDASKTREEIEVDVADGEALDAILDRLGFAPAATVRKERARYDLAAYHVVLDDVDGLGEFVEVEATATEGEVDRVREGARAVLEQLDLDPAAGIRTSYLGLLLEDE